MTRSSIFGEQDAASRCCVLRSAAASAGGSGPLGGDGLVAPSAASPVPAALRPVPEGLAHVPLLAGGPPRRGGRLLRSGLRSVRVARGRSGARAPAQDHAPATRLSPPVAQSIERR